MARIYTPVEGYTGTVAGVVFHDGHADVDHLTPAQARYFRGHGYGIDTPPPVAGERPAVAHPERVHVGTPLADGLTAGTRLVTILVDGVPVFEHRGPADDVDEWVAELAEAQAEHAAGPDPVVGTVEPVPVPETPDGVTVLPPGGEDVPAKCPNVRDGKPAWITWAIACGADPDEAAATSKEQLIATYKEA